MAEHWVDAKKRAKGDEWCRMPWKGWPTNSSQQSMVHMVWDNCDVGVHCLKHRVHFKRPTKEKEGGKVKNDSGQIVLVGREQDAECQR